MTSAQTHADPATSVRTDVPKSDLVERAKSIIGQYKTVMDEAYSVADPILNQALAATYAAVLDLQKHPDLLKLFLDDKRSGPISKNPIQPVFRKLWEKVLVRETVHRYSACLAHAKDENVKPGEFVGWVKKITIRRAASNWSSKQRRPDEQAKLGREQMSKRDQLLDKMTAIPLPDEIVAGLDPGIHLVAIRVSTEHKAEMFQFPDLAPDKVDGFILRNGR